MVIVMVIVVANVGDLNGDGVVDLAVSFTPLRVE